jgi:hypothetical protein
MLSLDEKKIEELGKAQCSFTEIAACTHVSHDTIERRYRQQIEAARLKGKAELRKAMWKKALSGDTAILRHLGKHYLGQTEHLQVMNSVEPEVRKLLAILENQELVAKGIGT